MHDTGRPPRDAVTGSWPAAIGGTDTIVAAATPPGRGGIGVVRVSGPAVPAIAEALLGKLPEPRRATFARFPDTSGEPIDAGIALYFPEPRSFTGEDVLELQGHGGPVILDQLVRRAVELGAQFERVLGAFRDLAALDLADVEPSTGATRLVDVLRADLPRPSMAVDALLANAPRREGEFYAVPKVIGEEA